MLAFSLLTVAFAAVASALPTAKRAILGPWCDNLGGGAFDNVSNFTVAAYNTTGTNTNTTGAPLVLGQAGAIDGASFKVFSVSRTLCQVPTTLGVSPVLPAAYMHMCVDVRDVSLQPVPLHCPRRRPSHPERPRHVPDCHQRHHRGLRGDLRREQLGRPYPERADLVCRGEFNSPCLLSSAHPPRRLERDPLTLILPFPARQVDTDPSGHGTGHPFLAVNSDTDSFSLCMLNSQNNVVYKAAAGNAYDFDSCYPVKLQLIY